MEVLRFLFYASFVQGFFVLGALDDGGGEDANLAKIIDFKQSPIYDVQYKNPKINKSQQQQQQEPVYDIVTIPASTLPQQQQIDDSQQQASTWMTVTKHVCPVDYVYDQELHRCRPQCADGSVFYNGTGACEIPDAAAVHLARHLAGKPDRAMCKNVTVDAAEFAVVVDTSGGERLRIAGTNFTLGRDRYVLSRDGSSAALCFPFTAHFVDCNRWKLREDEFELRRHGLQLWSTVHGMLHGPGDFYLMTDGGAVTCRPDSPESERAQKEAYEPVVDIYASAWTVSAISMLVSFVIYFASQKLRKSHTKVLLGHMVSLFIFYLALIMRAWGPVPNSDLCMAYGIVLHYTFLSALFWLNVLAFDIWKRLPRFHSQSSSSSSRHRFLLLSTYAWGCPLLLTGAAVMVDMFTDNHRFKPYFTSSCWFQTLESKALFMYGPAAFLLACNVFFFVMTVVKLRSFSKDVAFVNKKINNQMLKMYVKLLVVMGLCWIMEIVSALTHGSYLPYWYFTDIVNGLQGFFFFLVYVCKRSVLRDLMAAWKRRRCCRRLRPGVYFMRTSIRSTSQPEHFSSTSIIPSSDVHGSVCTGLSATNLSATVNQTPAE